MKFCTKCGAQIEDNAVFCSVCGASQQQPTVVKTPVAEEDKPSGGFAVLSFFFPLIGLILWLCWKEQQPLKAKSCGKGALVGFIVSVVLSILVTVLITIFAGGILASFPFEYYY